MRDGGFDSTRSPPRGRGWRESETIPSRIAKETTAIRAALHRRLGLEPPGPGACFTADSVRLLAAAWRSARIACLPRHRRSGHGTGESGGLQPLSLDHRLVHMQSLGKQHARSKSVARHLVAREAPCASARRSGTRPRSAARSRHRNAGGCAESIRPASSGSRPPRADGLPPLSVSNAESQSPALAVTPAVCGRCGLSRNKPAAGEPSHQVLKTPAEGSWA